MGCRFYFRALIYTMVMITSISAYSSAWVSTASRSGNQYIGEYSWPSEEMDGVLCNAASCYVAVCHYASSREGKCVAPGFATTNIKVPSGTTFKEARELFIKRNGVSGTWKTTTGVLPEGTCFGVLYWQGLGETNWTGVPIPGSYCGQVPLPDVFCDSQNEISFDYGVMQSDRINGATQTRTFKVFCNKPVNVSVTLVGGGGISLGNEIDVSLFIDNTDLSRGYIAFITNGERGFNMVSVLKAKTKNLSGGNFSGVGIVVIGYL
ncbi:TPA: hypothetical protein ACKQD3_000863 [Serratia marcescens]|nr:hypothetical protein [Serratia marcescens]MBN5381644.1 hypothetical protein [Serratia marcescens]